MNTQVHSFALAVVFFFVPAPLSNTQLFNLYLIRSRVGQLCGRKRLSLQNADEDEEWGRPLLEHAITQRLHLSRFDGMPIPSFPILPSEPSRSTSWPKEHRRGLRVKVRRVYR